jgi:hypothetical protein
MKRLVCIAIALSGCLSLSAQSTDKQSVIIGEKVKKPNAILHLNPPGKDQGFLPPQLSSAQRIGIKPYSPDDDGLIVFDITEKSYYHWNAGKWYKGFGPGAMPDPWGQAGKILTTDGTSLFWITHEKPGVNTGEGLTSLTDDKGVSHLSVNTDKKTININANNEMEINDGGITSAKITSGGLDKILVTDSDGHVTWADKTVFADDQYLKVTNNLLVIEGANSVDLSALSVGGQLSGTLDNLSILENTVSSENIRDNTIASRDILDATILEKDLASQAVTADKIASGGVNKVLSTNESGSVLWVERNTFSDGQALTLESSTNMLSIQNANSIDLNNLSLGGQITGQLKNLSIANNTITTTHIVDNAISAADIQSGAISSGHITDKTIHTSDIADGAVSSVLIADNSIMSGDILDNTITSGDIQDNTITTNDIASGGTSKILTTNASGQVNWADQSILQALDNSVLNETITNVALNANQLQITEATNESGVDLNQLAVNGDLTGNLNTVKVTKIQNQPVSPATLTGADAGKIMVWDGSQWVASQSTLNSGYYAMDPAQFTTFKSGNTTDRHNTQVLFSDDTFLTAYEDGIGEENIGGVNLSDGTVINELIVYYMDNDATRNMSLIFTRKSFMGGNEELFSWTSSGRVATISTITFTNFSGREVINNASYSYRIRVTFDVPNGDTWDSPDKALQRLYGVRIKYTTGH